jgi:hypothetical protein
MPLLMGEPPSKTSRREARSLLEEVAGGSGFKCFEDTIGIFINGDHDKLDLGELLLEAADAFHSIESGEIDVGEDDVGFVLWNSFESFLTIVVKTDEIESVGFLDPVRIDCTKGKVIFNNRDGNVV